MSIQTGAPGSLPIVRRGVLLRRAGQASTLEHAVLIAAVAAALGSMAVYTKRSMAGGLRNSASSYGEQYDPKHTVSDTTTTITSKITTESKLRLNVPIHDRSLNHNITADVMDITTKIEKDNTTRSGNETVDGLRKSLWK